MVAKEALDMPGMATTELPYTDYQVIRRARIFEWQRKWETSTKKLSYIKWNPESDPQQQQGIRGQNKQASHWAYKIDL